VSKNLFVEVGAALLDAALLSLARAKRKK